FDASPVGSNHLIGYREPKTSAAVATRARLIDAIKTIEDFFLILLWNSYSGVFNDHAAFVTFGLHRNRDLASLGRVLQRVLGDVAKSLMQPIAIAVDETIRFDVLFEGNVFCLGHRRELRVNRRHDVRQKNLSKIEDEVVRVGSRKQKQVVGKLAQ